MNINMGFTLNQTNRSIYSRIFRVFVLTGIIFVSLILLFLLIEHKQEQLFSNVTKDQINNEIAALIKTKTAVTQQVVYDYTYYGELVSNIHKPDSFWLENNIATIINSFHVNYVAVYDINRRMVYEEPATLRHLFNNQIFDTLYQKRFLNWFVISNNELFEVSSATVHSDNDPDHKTTQPQGYFFIVKRWDDVVLNEIGLLTSSEISVSPNIDANTSTTNSNIVTTYALKYYDGTTIGYLTITRKANSFLLFKNLAFYALVSVVGSFLLILLFLFFSFKRLINKPLKLIRSILEDEQASDIQLLQNCKGEFKDIGFLLEAFLNQKQALKQARDVALAEEEKYHSLFQHMLNGYAFCKMVFIDNAPADIILLEVNQSFQQQTKFSNVKGKSISSLVPAVFETDIEVLKRIARILKTGKAERFEYYIKALDNWVDYSIYAADKEHFIVLFDVITAKKRWQDEIRLSNSRLIRAQRVAQIGSWEKDLLTGELHWSEQMFALLGVNPSQVLTSDVIKAIFSQDEYNRVTKAIEESKAYKKPYSIDYKIVTHDSKTRYLHDEGEVICNENGLAIRMHGTTQNITDRVMAEKKVFEIGQYYQSIIDNAPDGIVVLDQDSKFKYFSPSAIRMFGYEASDVSSVIPNEKTHPDDLPMVLQELGQLLQNPDYKPTLQYRFQRKDTTWIWIESTFSNMFLNPYVNGIVINFRDITFKKQSELALEESKHFLDRIINSIPVGMFWKDLSLKYQGCNKSFAQHAGFSDPNEIIGKSDFELCWGDKALDYQADDLAVINSGNSKLNIEETLKRHDGSTIFLLTGKTPLRNIHGEIIGVLGSFYDISLLKKTQFELIAARMKAEENDRLKTAFLANMSHEIRTPMNGILGFAGLLKDPESTAQDQELYIQMIEKSGKRMLRTINDIIDISKIEAGQMDISISQVNINQQLTFILQFFLPEAKAKGLKLSANLSLPDEKAFFYTDLDKFSAILTNLVKNAIKYTLKGEVSFGYSMVGRELHLYVNDTGIGIPNDRQVAIFDRFVQADIADKMALEGSGLGLTISKAFAEMLGGKITVESQVGVGSKFSVHLPVKGDVRELESFIGEKHHIVKVTAVGCILIVEDEPVSEKFFDAALRKTNYKLLHAHSGAEAIDICKQNADIDIILMDIKMPEMNGYEATRRIREFNKNVIIIAQTAFCQTGERSKAIEAGCNDYLTKPISTSALLATLKKHLENTK